MTNWKQKLHLWKTVPSLLSMPVLQKTKHKYVCFPPLVDEKALFYPDIISFFFHPSWLLGEGGCSFFLAYWFWTAWDMRLRMRDPSDSRHLTIRASRDSHTVRLSPFLYKYIFFIRWRESITHTRGEGPRVIDMSVDHSAARLYWGGGGGGIDWIPQTCIITACFFAEFPVRVFRSQAFIRSQNATCKT